MSLEDGNGTVAAAMAAILPPKAQKSEQPDWAPDTIEALDRLTPLESAFVQHWIVCLNAAEAYRLAAGVEPKADGDFSRTYGYAIRSRPRVKVAIALAMRDTSFDARYDKDWMMRKLERALEKAEASDDPKDQKTVAYILKVMAELKGQIRQEPPSNASNQPGNIHILISQIVAEAKGLKPGPEDPDHGKAGETVIRIANAPVGASKRTTGPGLAQ